MVVSKFGNVLAAGLFSLCIGSAAHAEEGSFSAHFGWLAVGTAHQLTEGHIYWVGEYSGTLFNDAGAGMMHLASVACPANADLFADKEDTYSGYCTVTDLDGDKAFAKWSCTGTGGKCAGTAEWVKGTGKYEGISGEWPFTGRNHGHTTEAGLMGYAFWDASYTLP